VGVKSLRKYRLKNTRRENPKNLYFLDYLLQTAEGGSSEVKYRQTRVFYTHLSTFYTTISQLKFKAVMERRYRRYTSFYRHIKSYPGPQFANTIQRRNYIKEYARPRHINTQKS